MQNIWQHIYAAFIEADRWKLYLKGLGVTLEVSFFCGTAWYPDWNDCSIFKIVYEKKRFEDDSIPYCERLY